MKRTEWLLAACRAYGIRLLALSMAWNVLWRDVRLMWTEYLLPCAHDDGPLYRTEKDYDGREYQIEVCRHCRYEDEAA